VLRERSEVAEQRVQGATRHQFARDEHGAVFGDPAVRADDVGVVQPDRLFPDESQQVTGVPLTEELRGAVPAPFPVERTPDGARSAGPDRIAQGEATGDHVRRHTDHPPD